MSTQNVQNPIYLQPVQNNIPVQQPPIYIPPQCTQGQVPVCPPIQNNYIPRYMPLIQQGQVYPVPVPPQIQQNKPGGNVGTVNITINGVNPPGQATPAPQYAPPVAPYYPPVNTTVQEVKKESPAPPKEPTPAPATEKKPEEKVNKKPAVELTDVYIQQLEKKLNNKDKNERAHAVAELVNRFKEDETRKDDPCLTNLLNLALQDDSKPIIFAAMQALENGYANGNPITIQRLQTIRDARDNFGNSETADLLLTKLTASPSEVKTTSDIPGQKLNLVSR